MTKNQKPQTFRGRPNPDQRINALPSNKVYDPATGPGTGRPARGIATQNRDGSFSALSGLGSPTGPLSQPLRRPSIGGDATAKRDANVRASKADGSFASKQLDYNRRNPGLYMDSGGTIGAHVNAEEQINRAAKQDGAGYFIKGRTPPGSASSPAPSTSTAGQAESMRRSMAPNPNEDRWGRTVNSPSARGTAAPAAPNTSSMARGEWQSGVAGTTRISSGYGTGSSNMGSVLAGPPKTSGTIASRPPPAPLTTTSTATSLPPPPSGFAVSRPPPMLTDAAKATNEAVKATIDDEEEKKKLAAQ